MSVPSARLSPRDFYPRLDAIRDGWYQGEGSVEAEHGMTRRLQELRRLLEQLPAAWWREARPLLERLGYLRLVRGQEYEDRIEDLQRLVSAWDSARPPMLECKVCGVALRGHSALANHYVIVHPDTDDAAVARG
jgi:hypothetical protein